MILDFLEINQPIGTFYLSKMSASNISKFTQVNQRSDENSTSVQREDSEKRIKEISAYSSDPDATFPTPIIISIYDNSNVEIKDSKIIIHNENKKIGEILDGQHRIRGLENSLFISEFEMPIILMFNLTEEEKAYVFSIINSKQTKVSMSLIYDLFSLSKKRSPQKTMHEIARTFNNDKKSPYYNRLKMLGKKEEGQDLASLSQGTFVNYIIKLISKKPDEDMRKIKREEDLIIYNDLPLRGYFINEDDDIIYKILLNCFNGLSKVFHEEWINPDSYILSKTTGFGAVIKSFNKLYLIGDKKNDLTEEFFINVFTKFKNTLIEKDLELTSEYFPSSEHTQSKLSKLILSSIIE